MTLHGSRGVRIPYLSLRSPIFDRGTDSIGSKLDRQSIANSFKHHPPSSKKVQVGKDQEKAQSEKESHSKNQGGKKPN